jgi:hypothetical protein
MIEVAWETCAQLLAQGFEDGLKTGLMGSSPAD